MVYLHIEDFILVGEKLNLVLQLLLFVEEMLVFGVDIVQFDLQLVSFGIDVVQLIVGSFEVGICLFEICNNIESLLRPLCAQFFGDDEGRLSRVVSRLGLLPSPGVENDHKILMDEEVEGLEDGVDEFLRGTKHQTCGVGDKVTFTRVSLTRRQ